MNHFLSPHRVHSRAPVMAPPRLRGAMDRSTFMPVADAPRDASAAWQRATLPLRLLERKRALALAIAEIDRQRDALVREADALTDALQPLAEIGSGAPLPIDRTTFDRRHAAIAASIASLATSRVHLAAVGRAVDVELARLHGPLADAWALRLEPLLNVRGAPFRRNAEADQERSFFEAECRRSAHLLGQEAALVRDQRQLRGLIDDGALDGLPGARLRHLNALAGADVRAQLGKVAELRVELRRIEQRRPRPAVAPHAAAPAFAGSLTP